MIKLIIADVFKNVNTSFGSYEISLILGTGNKTCTQMVFENNTSYEKLTTLLYSEPLFEENIKILMKVIKKNIKNVSFIIDDTFIPKEYSQKNRRCMVIKRWFWR